MFEDWFEFLSASFVNSSSSSSGKKNIVQVLKIYRCKASSKEPDKASSKEPYKLQSFVQRT
jgi:hypothetical protein